MPGIQRRTAADGAFRDSHNSWLSGVSVWTDFVKEEMEKKLFQRREKAGIVYISGMLGSLAPV